MIKKILISALIVFIAAVLILLYGYFTGGKTADKHQRDDQMYMQAMIEGAKDQDVKMLVLALEDIISEKHQIREAAAESLGYYEQAEALQSLKTLLSDNNVAVRIRAIRALSHRPSAEREEILVEYLNSSKLQDEEKAHFWGSLLKISDNDEYKTLGLKHLLYLSEQAKSKKTQSLAFSYLLDRLIEYPGAMDKIKAVVIQSDNGIIVSNGIRRLAQSEKGFINENSKLFLDHSDDLSRIAYIQSLHILCPKNRVEIFSEILKAHPELKSEVESTMNFHGHRIAGSLNMPAGESATDRCQ